MIPHSPTLPHLVRDNALATPDAPALVAGDVRWSWAQLDDQARRAAGVLAGLGAGRGASVALLAPNTARWLATALGAMRAGARVDAVNTWVKAWDLEHVLDVAQCHVLVTVAATPSTDVLSELRDLLPELWDAGPDGWRSARFPALRHVIVLEPGAELPPGARRWDDLPGTPVAADAIDARPDEPAYVMFTSGSTSRPKAVPLCQRDLVVNGFHIGERMGLTAADRVWLGSPLFWSFGGANALLATFTHGACLVLQERFAAADAARLIAAERCTAAYLLPSIIDALAGVAADVRAAGTLRTGVTIGRPDEIARAVDELGVAGICNVYGSTETYGNCCVTHHDAPLELRLTTQGPPLPGVEVRIVDDDGTVLPVGGTGELQVRGRVMPGYLGDAPKAFPEGAAPEALGCHSGTDGCTPDGWFRTGDRMRLRPDGAVEFAARLTDMIKTSGINVAPAEVEGFLSGHPAVTDVAVVGAPHPSRGEVVVAFVTVDGAVGSIDGDELRAWCRAGIAGFKVPWEIVVVDALPRTGTGKLTRTTLVEQAAQRVQAAEGA